MGTAIDIQCIKLPSLPAAAAKVIALVQDPDVDVQALGKVIEYDPALAARLVRLANGSLFGMTRDISSVRQAIVILGLRTVKLAALSFTLLDSLGPNSRSTAMAHCWRRILTNAMACRLLGPLFELDAEEAFLAGLMQDIGSLVCAQNLGPKFLELVERSCDENEPDLEVLEREIFGVSHVEVSVKLMEHWRLPNRLTMAIKELEDVDLKAAFEAKHRDLPVLLATAAAISGFLLKPSVKNLDQFNLVSDAFGESSSEVDKFLQKLEMQVVEMAELLELNLPEGMDYETILDRARELSKDLRVENREQLPLRVRQELARAKRENCCLSLLFLRLMTVSQLAKAGQTQEAEKLQHIAARHLQEVTRECDAIFRLNLSTFCLLATNTPMEGVERLIQRLMSKLGSTNIDVGGETIDVQFAFGVVIRDKDSKNDVNVESFLLKANDNLSDAIQRHELVVTTTF